MHVNKKRRRLYWSDLILPDRNFYAAGTTARMQHNAWELSCFRLLYPKLHDWNKESERWNSSQRPQPLLKTMARNARTLWADLSLVCRPVGTRTRTNAKTAFPKQRFSIQSHTAPPISTVRASSRPLLPLLTAFAFTLIAFYRLIHTSGCLDTPPQGPVH